MRNRTALAALLACSMGAEAHVTLTAQTAAAGSRFVAGFRIGHGCAGAATTGLRIEVPDGVASAKPQPKPGWTLAVEHQTLAAPRKGDMGESITQRVSAVSWTGGTLPDDQFDDFALLVKLPADAGKLAFPATQSCGAAVEHWSGADASHPAPVLTLTPASGGAMPDTMGMMPGMTMGSGARADASVTDGWFRALPSGLPAGGYFTVTNNGAAPLTLTGAASPDCAMLMLHKSQNAGGISNMQDVTAVEVPAKGTLAFAPGSYHLMCMNPSANMKPGGHSKVTLSFAGGSSAEADFAIRDASGK